MKVDFQKAYDSVCWDFLDDLLSKFDIYSKWRSWIRGCLFSSMGTILVNGAPSDEFQFHYGLCQGDPLSPFLFILVMESLYIAFQRTIDRGLFIFFFSRLAFQPRLLFLIFSMPMLLSL